MQNIICYIVLFLISCLTLSSANECFKQASDIVFVLDSSFSIRKHDFQRQLSFVRAIIDKFTIGKNHIQVGVVSYASEVQVDIRLDEYNNNRDLKIAISNIHHRRTGSLAHEALSYIHTHMYEPEMGGRPWAKHQLVLISDGFSMNTSATMLQASMARSKGIEIFSVGVGQGMDDFEIRGVASEPKDMHVFRVEDYKALMGIENAMSTAACQEPGYVSDAPAGDNDDNSVPSASSACKKHVADVVFLMDSSSSIWRPDFQRQIKFIQEVISSFDIGHDATRVGLVAYSDAPITLVALDDLQTSENIQKALSNAPYITGNTNTALAIEHVRRNVFAYGVTRADVAKILVVLSDGKSGNMDETIAQAYLAQSENLKVFAIGIGNQTKASELMDIASDPDDKFVFHVDDYEALSGIKELLAIKTCDVAAAAMKDVPAQCPTLPTDVFFIYDTTALSLHHHKYVINVISDVTNSRQLNSKDLRLGVVREAATTASGLHDIELTNQWDQSNFKNELQPDSRTASIDLLLRKVRHKYFHPTMQYMHREKTVIVFLDSALENSFGSTIEAIRLRRAWVRIIVVALGKHAQASAAVFLVSSPQDKYTITVPSVHDYNEKDVVSKILSFLCD